MDESRGSSSKAAPLPGQVYEAVARKLFETDPVTHLNLLGIRVTGTPEILSQVFPSVTLPGDILLVRVASNRLAHVEYVHEVPDDLEPRMTMYRSLIARAYPDDQLSQHVIVLGDELAAE